MHAELASQPYSPLITLMTVDYLLTARDLPGWAGTIPPIDYRKVLLKGLNELAHGLYGEERVCRELTILQQIAEQHGLGDYFRSHVRGARRNRTREPFDGAGVNASAFFVDGPTYQLRNIFDAAHAAKYLYQAYADLSPSNVLRLITRSLRYRIGAMGKGAPFPPEAEWASGGAPAPR